MASTPAPDHLVGILRDTVVALVRRDGPDLSARQLGVFLTCYLQDGAHTVRGLAADLHVSKPAITRALDRLGELDLARRKVDPLDRRSVLVQRTLGCCVPARPAGGHDGGGCRRPQGRCSRDRNACEARDRVVVGYAPGC